MYRGHRARLRAARAWLLAAFATGAVVHASEPPTVTPELLEYLGNWDAPGDEDWMIAATPEASLPPPAARTAERTTQGRRQASAQPTEPER